MNPLLVPSRLPLPAGHLDFDDLLALESDLLDAVGGLDVFEEKLRGFFRAAIDEVIDTARTGRFFFNQLEKTEKTYLGTKFEIILRDWLQVPRGVTLDLLIGGREVDVKSTTGGAFGWMIPPEAIGQLCILLMINEEEATCSFGLVRARASYLRQGGNRDSKTSFTAAARSNIWWMARDFPYTSNFWHRVQEKDRTEIMSLKGGSRRVACLFERYQGVAISRVQILAVARQDDAMRRLRRGSGARGLLARKGIAILYSGYDRELMLSLGLTFGWREFMSFSPETPVQADLLRSAGHID